MLKLTSEPVHDEFVGSHLLARGVCDLEKQQRGIDCATFGVHGLTFTFLLVHTKDLEEDIRSVLGVGKLGAELLSSCFGFAI